MKKFLALILALVMALSLVACGEKKDDPKTEGDTATGSVYYLNFKPESDAAWQTLAAAYTAETGVPVKVVTAASGQYDTTLTAEMDKDAAPTMFQVGNLGAVNSYGEFCYNLEGTDVYNQMTTHDFDLKNADGETVSIGYCYEAFGIIVNKALLEKAGHSLDEITNFESLKAVADDIHARAAELGFDAFTSAGLDGSSAWRFSGHLANMPLFYEFRDDNVTAQPATIKGTYLDNYKAIWDLYPVLCCLHFMAIMLLVFSGKFLDLNTKIARSRAKNSGQKSPLQMAEMVLMKAEQSLKRTETGHIWSLKTEKQPLWTLKVNNISHRSVQDAGISAACVARSMTIR